MARKLAGILRWFVLLAGVGVFATCLAESVETLPAPKGYVNDFAGILSHELAGLVEGGLNAHAKQ